MKSKIKGVIAAAFFLLGLIITGSDIAAQSGLQMSVSGYVRDVATKMPIPGVTVYIFRANRDTEDIDNNVFSGTSDVNGHYKVRFLDAGKYSFSIEIPGIGGVHIGMIANDGSSTAGYYDFEIEEARNKMLNIFLGTNSYPHIERKDCKLRSEINFTMLYVMDSKEASRSAQRGHVCNGMEIFEPGEPRYVTDETQIIVDGKEKDGVFKYQFEHACFNECRNRKCGFGFCQAELMTSIELHGPDWVKKKHPGWSNELIACQIDCLLKHEKVHYSMLIPICCEEWNNFLNSRKNKNICCEKNQTCKDFTADKWKIFLDNVDAKMNGTETNANQVQQACISPNCEGK
ncbi:MAG TPA: carboxypeptidase-like regulatory domain-containing protein [Candidatus Kapabacteria bacterium]|nr:carboxypeptidase-like regulatory domain-containing protein [Candidatus Kapabacteria bacterium]